MTDHRREIYEEVVFNDMSLSEAAEEYGVSRQGIHDMIRRCDLAMEAYEEKLHLVRQAETVKKTVLLLQKKLDETGMDGEKRKELKQLTEQIMQEME